MLVFHMILEDMFTCSIDDVHEEEHKLDISVDSYIMKIIMNQNNTLCNLRSYRTQSAQYHLGFSCVSLGFAMTSEQEGV